MQAILVLICIDVVMIIIHLTGILYTNNMFKILMNLKDSGFLFIWDIRKHWTNNSLTINSNNQETFIQGYKEIITTRSLLQHFTLDSGNVMVTHLMGTYGIQDSFTLGQTIWGLIQQLRLTTLLQPNPRHISIRQSLRYLTP